MVIEVNHKYHYNAPPEIRVGDQVELPRAGFDRHNTPTTWIGIVTDVPTNHALSYTGDIRAIVGKVKPLLLTFEAQTKREMVKKLIEAADDLED